MKRRILVLGVIISCLLGLTACGESENTNSVAGSRYKPEEFTVASVKEYAEKIEDTYFENWYLQGTTDKNVDEMHYFEIADEYGDDVYTVISKGYESWYKAIQDIGFTSKDTLKDEVYVKDTSFYITKDGKLCAQNTIAGTKHDANLEIYFNNKFEPTEMGVTVDRTRAEKLQNAGLNTLLGMGMAFTILIIISLIISLFPILFGGGNKKKKESDKEITQKAMENATNQIAEQEELTSDAELVAVIAAAIAAYEGSGSTDGFVVRSIRKRNSNWKKY